MSVWRERMRAPDAVFPRPASGSGGAARSELLVALSDLRDSC